MTIKIRPILSSWSDFLYKKVSEVKLADKLVQIAEKLLDKKERYEMLKIKVGKNKSIKAKLIASFFVPVILMIALGVVSYTKSSQGMSSTYEASTMTSLTMTTNYFSVVLNAISNKAIQLVADDSIQNYFSGNYKKDPTQESQKLREISKRISIAALSDNFISKISVLADYGRGISSNSETSLPDMYSEFAESPEVKEFLATQKNYYYLPYHTFLDKSMNTKADEYSLAYICYLNNPNFKKIGYVIVDLKLESVTKILADLNLGKDAKVAFVAGKNREIFKGTAAKDFKFESQTFYQDSVKSKKENGYEYVDYKGKSYLYAYSKIAETDMMVCSLIPKSTILMQSKKVLNVTVGIVVFACFIAIIIGTIMASGISGIIRKANYALEKAGNGDLTVEIKTKRKDEFSNLTKSITNMITSVKNIIRKMTGITNTVFGLAKEVSENSEILLKATQDIALAVGDIEQGITQQSSDAESCLYQMEDLAKQISNVYQNTTEIATIAHNTNGIIGEGIVIIEDLNTKAKNTSDITQTIIEDIGNLEEESQQISGIIQTMNEISAQTNLLSLNASIEAARAGTVGKGFAVVAEEIRKLADQSSDAAYQIGNIIEQIQGRTKQTVITAKQAEEIVNSQTDALSKTVRVFDSISKHVEKLTTNLDSISSGISNIERTKDDTLGAIESISATAEETAAASTNLRETANHQLKAVEALNKVAIGLQEDAINLEEAVNIFKINAN